MCQLKFSWLLIRLARAVREKGKDKVEGGEDDTLCVICLGPPVDPVEVRFPVGLRGAYFLSPRDEFFLAGLRVAWLIKCSSFENVWTFCFLIFDSCPTTAPLRSQVLQVVHGAAARKAGRSDMPALS